MAGWIWVLAGVLLMGVEALAIDALFYLIFIGAGALLTGFLVMAGLTMPLTGQLLLFAVISAFLLVVFRKRVYLRLRHVSEDPGHSAVGALVQVPEEVAVHGQTRVRLNGSDWTATNVGASPIAANARARVLRIEGVELQITEAAPGPSAEGT